jgi:hypothetical protein
MHTCRFCGKQETTRMVKYAARHWAHFSCWFNQKIKELAAEPTRESLTTFFSERLHDWQIYQFPVFHFSDWIAARGLRKSGKKAVDFAMEILQGAAARNIQTVSFQPIKTQKVVV